VLALAARVRRSESPRQYHGIETSYGAITVPKLDQGYNLEFFGTDTHLIPLGAQNFPAAGTVGEGRQREARPSADRIDNAITRDSLVIAGDVAITGATTRPPSSRSSRSCAARGMTWNPRLCSESPTRCATGSARPSPPRASGICSAQP
jgi:hypothetical protein